LQEKVRYKVHSFRNAEVILEQPEYIGQFLELYEILESITEEDMITTHESFGKKDVERTPKSISVAINKLLKDRFTELDWSPESAIFQDSNYRGDTWRLDFAKKDISIEVGFNHSSVIAWNLIKPVLASELNHVEKAIQTQIGVIITVTQEMQAKGGFDSAIGVYEKYLDFLKPLRNLLTSPLLIIGIDAPDTFEIKVEQYAPRKKIGVVVRI
jgi:hypothetical protein